MSGWTSELELGFAHHGVLVVWSKTATWAENLEAVVASLRRPGAQDPSDADGDGLHARLVEAALAELAAQVVRVPQFRRARYNDREAAAREVPEVAERSQPREHRWQMHSVVRRAVELLEVEVEACIERLRPRRDELAALLAADEDYRVIRTADVRQRFAQDWILTHSDGLRLPPRWTKELVANTKNPLGKPAQLRL